MTLYAKKMIFFPCWRARLYVGLWVLAVLVGLGSGASAQPGPYFYGKPNPATGTPDPPVPATDYYTIGATEGLPTYLDPVSDPINPSSNPNFLKDLNAALPDGRDRSGNLGVGGAADLTVAKENAEIFLVFATEGASAKNSLGYFIYKGDVSPTDLEAPNPLVPGKSYLESRRIIFPNASLAPGEFQPTSGGRLLPGNRVKLIGDLPNGNFSQGTRIAWFLVSRGWDGNQVSNGFYVLYSNPELNPGKARQTAVLDFTASSGRTVLAFEDTKRTPDGGADNDFNDVVFYINEDLEGAQTVYYPDCSGQFVLTKEEYDRLPKDGDGRLLCPVKPPPVTNLALTAVCSADPTNQLAWKITNPNAEQRPFTWTITDGVTTTVKLASPTVLNALPGDNIIFTSPVSGVNAMTISVEGVVQPGGTAVVANTVPCDDAVVIPPFNCCVAFASEVVAYRPGFNRTGGALSAERTQASSALGTSGPATSYVSLGFSGGTPADEASIVLKFPKPVRGFINVYETTFGAVMPNFVETAEVYGSLDGSIFYKMGVANNQEKGSVDIHRTTFELKGAYAQIQYLKLVDITPKASMPDDADGFDLEAVCASDFALQTVAIDPNVQPGSVKVNPETVQPSQAPQRNGNPVWGKTPNKDSEPSCVVAGLCDPEGIDRTNISNILARDDAFFSLGIGGSLVVEFKEPVSGGLVLYERTGDPKPSNAAGAINYLEKVAVYVKAADCEEWGDPIGFADNQGPQLGVINGSFDHQTYKSVISLGGRTVKFVKLVDVTPVESTSKDGYDVDFIASTSNATALSGDAVVGSNGNRAELSSGRIAVTAFPNPSRGRVTVDFGYRETGYIPNTPTVITISDPVGTVVLTRVREPRQTEAVELDLSSYRNGIYFLSIRCGDEVLNSKILLQR